MGLLACRFSSRILAFLDPGSRNNTPQVVFLAYFFSADSPFKMFIQFSQHPGFPPNAAGAQSGARTVFFLQLVFSADLLQLVFFTWAVYLSALLTL
jgi:hypothetical protein